MRLSFDLPFLCPVSSWISVIVGGCESSCERGRSVLDWVLDLRLLFIESRICCELALSKLYPIDKIDESAQIVLLGVNSRKLL